MILTLALAACAFAANRADYERYLGSVFNVSDYSSLTDQQVFDLYSNLTFYYQGNPPMPNGQRRVQSHQYAGTTCDCLHIQLPACIKAMPPSFPGCTWWNVTTYLNMDWVAQQEFIPDNAWFEGLTYVGEWGFPISCSDPKWSSKVYGWNRHIWLYPLKGLGYWFNAGKTAAAWNKLHWLIKYGVGVLGQNKVEIMDYMADVTCPGYQNVTSGCDICPNPTVQGKCCCHGAGRNLGVQVGDYKRQYRVSWDQALSDVADMYINGMFGEDGRRYYWPNGTYFGYVNLLDDDILRLQDKYSFVTAQFVREPQHTLVGQEFSDPVYAFEILTNYDRSTYTWQRFCQRDGSDFGVLDPVAQYQNYMNKGYLLSGSGKVLPMSAWKPRPEFLAQFQRNFEDFDYDPAEQVDDKTHGRW